MKYAIPNIYSIWEGFVKAVFRIYINKFNALGLVRGELNINIITHSIDSNFHQMTTGISEFSKKINYISSLETFMDSPIEINQKLPTESNVDFKVINQILDRFNLELLPETPYRGYLINLLKLRNRIAHGEFTNVTQSMIDTHTTNVSQLMTEITKRIVEGATNHSYRN